MIGYTYDRTRAIGSRWHSDGGPVTMMMGGTTSSETLSSDCKRDCCLTHLTVLCVVFDFLEVLLWLYPDNLREALGGSEASEDFVRYKFRYIRLSRISILRHIRTNSIT